MRCTETDTGKTLQRPRIRYGSTARAPAAPRTPTPTAVPPSVSGARALPSAQHTLHIEPGILASFGRIRPLLIHNPTIALHDGALRAIVRVRYESNRAWHTTNIFGRIDTRSWAFVEQRIMKDHAPGTRFAHGHTHGYEDCRLFVLGGKLAASATVCDRLPHDKWPKIAVLALSGDGDVVDAAVQPSPRHEKNWMPFVYGGSLHFVYSVDPLLVLHYDEASRRVQPLPADIGAPGSTIRGGSQLVPYGDGFLAVVHEMLAPGPRYLHRFVRFDREVRPVRTSEPFFFQQLGIEFCTGLAPVGDEFVLSYGVNDRQPRLAVVSKDVVAAMVGAS